MGKLLAIIGKDIMHKSYLKMFISTATLIKR